MRIKGRGMRKAKQRAMQERIALLSFLSLPLLVYFVFCLLPCLEAVYYSFCRWNGFSGDVVFVGFRNYVQLFATDKLFAVSLQNTVIYNDCGGCLSKCYIPFGSRPYSKKRHYK
jgi:ABC-type sugar transport system permease subunit